MKKNAYPVFLAFLCMGFGDAVGPFVGLAKEQFALSNFEAQFIAFMGFIMFGLLSIPMGLYQDRKGKKVVLMMGLCLGGLGVTLPLFGLTEYFLFLLTILLLGAGAAILQVAGNPIMRDVSEEGKYSRNLSIGQLVKAVGSLSGSLIPFAAGRWFGLEWTILFPLYAGFFLLTVAWIGLTKFDESKQATPANLSSCLSLLRNPFIGMMVAGILFYVGAEVCMSTGVPLLLNQQFGVELSTWGLLGNAFFFMTILVGRLLGSFILSYISPLSFFRITVVVALAGLAMVFTSNLYVTLLGIFFTGFGFANIFPLIFSIAVDHMPERTNEISGLMVTAIVGGAILPPLMGVLADEMGIQWGFVIPLLATVYILYLALNVPRFITQKAI